MNILEVPKVLFQEFSQKLGMGDEWKQRTDDGVFLLKRVIKVYDPEEKAQKAKGYTMVIAPMIGFRDDSDSEGPHHIFALWGLVPVVFDKVFDPKPALKIIARAENAGVWAAGRGNYMKEACKAEFSFYGMTLDAPSSRLIPVILQRAVELAYEAKTERYWEKDHHPERKFTEPSR